MKVKGFLYLLIILSTAALCFQGIDYKAKVQRVIDGDTILLENREKVRYIGIDTPETKHPLKGVEYFGQEAYEANKQLVEGKTVRLAFDVQQRDRYGRLLAYVYLEDGTFVNAWLVENGYAQVATYPPNVKYQKLFLELQRKAREENRGLWAEASEEQITPAPEEKEEDIIVYITRTGKRYHREGCSSLRKSKIAITLKEAVERGYTLAHGVIRQG